jgi:hypothetical protein
MKVKDLKRECLRRKLSIKRNKSELATRLEENGFEISIDLCNSFYSWKFVTKRRKLDHFGIFYGIPSGFFLSFTFLYLLFFEPTNHSASKSAQSKEQLLEVKSVGRYFHALKGLERVSSFKSTSFCEPNGFAHEAFHRHIKRTIQ